ncbi:MAG: anthranilate phosphoribosyltransferase [Cytophagales bacterium]
MNFKDTLISLHNKNKLTQDEAYQALLSIGKGEVNPSQMASFMTVFLMRDLEYYELLGFRKAMLEMCISVEIEDFEAIDVCGTGGDGKNTFNISTTSMFVAAAAGVKIAKHGNYAVSSASGSSNVLEHLGFKFTNDIGKLKNSLEHAGICVLHAPLFHPSMKHVAPIRKELGVKTFFNILGPISNPSKPKAQVTGVFDLSILRLYGQTFNHCFQQFRIVHSLDVYDEISLTGKFRVKSENSETEFSPSDLDLHKQTPDSLFGGSVAECANILVEVLKGKGTKAQNEVVAANAGLAIHMKNEQLSLKDAVAQAMEIIQSGKAYQNLTKLIEHNS